MRKTSSVLVHHPGPLSLPVAPGTMLSCMPSVIWASVSTLWMVRYLWGEAVTYLPPAARCLALANGRHVAFIVVANVPHVGDEEVELGQVVDRVVDNVGLAEGTKDLRPDRSVDCMSVAGLTQS